MYKMGQKLIASVLATIIILAEFSLIGIYGGKVYAEEIGYEDQNTKISNADAEFDSYFMEGDEKIHIARKQIEDENSMYLYLNVKSGYIKDAQIEIAAENGEEKANFKLAKEIENTSVQEIDDENNIIKLNQINTGNAKVIEIPISFNYSEEILPSEFARILVAKLTGTYVDSNRNEKKIEKEIYTYLAWKENLEDKTYLKETISKFIPYEIGEQKGVIVEETINTKVDGNLYPTKDTNIEIEVPLINEIKPTSVMVYASTEATNGDKEGYNFNEENYTYNEEENKLTILVENKKNQDGKVIWKKDVTDEYKVIYIYPEAAKEIVDSEGTVLERKVNLLINLYAEKEAKVSGTSEKEGNFKDKIGEITKYELNGKVQNISKGQMYANYLSSEEKINTVYNEDLVINVTTPTLIDKVEFETIKDVMQNGEEEIAVLKNTDIIYKKISVNKNNLIKILGQNARVKIYNGETLISTIDEEVIESAEDLIEINLEEFNINSIKVETSKPEQVGKLIFNIEKVIKGSLSIEKEQLEQVDNLKEQVKVISKNGEEVLEEKTLENVINFVEPETKASIRVNKENLSTILKNEKVEFTVVLNTDDYNNRLFKNPTITLKLPKCIEKVDIKDTKILFDDELAVKKSEVIDNEDGSKSIIVTIEGEQTKYNIESITGGTGIIIITDLTVNKLTSNKKENVVMTYENMNDGSVKQDTVELNFVAPIGVITTSSIENYAEGREELTLINGIDAIAKIDVLKDARDAKFNMNVINNYDNTISDVVILGRIPTGTFDMKLKSAIKVNDIDENEVQIYYSTNKEADKDLEKEENAWKQEVENYETVKSYLIVVNKIINKSEAVSFEYTAQIPANLNYNEEAIESYIVYFKNNLPTGTIDDREESKPIPITTGIGPVLEASIESNIPSNRLITSGNIIKYTVKVKNTGSEKATDTKIIFSVPTTTKYIEYKDEDKKDYIIKDDSEVEFEIGILNVNETIEKEIYVLTQDSYSDGTHTVTAKARIIANEFEKQLETNEVTNIVKDSLYNIKIISDEENLDENVEYKYKFYVSTKGLEKENVTFETKIPEGLTYKEVKVSNYKLISGDKEEIELDTNYDSKTRILSMNLDRITGNNAKQIEITVTTNNLNENEYEKIINISGTVKDDKVEETSLDKTIRIVKEGLEITQSANIPSGSKISKGEKIEYTVTVKNIGSKAMIVKLKDALPKELKFETLVYELLGNEMNHNESKDNTVEYSFHLAEGETKVIKIKAEALEVDKDTEVSNIVKVSTEKISEIESNKITYIIEKTVYVDPTPQEPEKPQEETPALVKLGGVVWNDKNKNGIKEAGEDLLEDVQVVLLDMKTNKLFKQNNKVVDLRTDANGIYTFENVPSGKYVVIFLYDTGLYSATVYKNKEADEYTNSDAIDTKIKLLGNYMVAAITDTITLKESNMYNIDLGLVDNPKFDLKLDMQISKITVQKGEETKVYEYENTNLAKVEFTEKYLNGSTMIVEYSIKVTNQGAVEGYVKKIADYLPKELSFNSELNRDWYENENGTVYNASLANIKILPGETKEVKLTLTKQISQNALGTINNRAEIYEAYNDKGFEDIDSTPANQNSNEDDYSSADLVLSIKTGKMVMFVGLTLTIITIIGTSAYIIKKKVLR